MNLRIDDQLVGTYNGRELDELASFIGQARYHNGRNAISSVSMEAEINYDPNTEDGDGNAVAEEPQF
jgi:hypothetical protein